jgi:hypothetical protein
MIYKKWFLCLAGLIALTAISSSIFLYLKMNELSDKLVLNEASKEESVTPSIPGPVDQSLDRAVNNTDLYDKIKELEYQLKAAEEELDMASDQLTDVLDENNKEATLEETRKTLMVRKTGLEVERDYVLMQKRLDLSPEDANEFKRIELEWRLADQENWISPESTPEEIEKSERLNQENSDKYTQELIDLLGEDKFMIYDTFKKSTGEMWELNTFMANMSPEDRISYDVAGDLFFGMSEVRIANEKEMGLEATRNSSDSEEDKFIREYEVALETYKKYEDVAPNILPPEQAEIFNTQLGEHRKMFEEQYKMILLLRKDRKEKEDVDVAGPQLKTS